MSNETPGQRAPLPVSLLTAVAFTIGTNLLLRQAATLEPIVAAPLSAAVGLLLAALVRRLRTRRIQR
jgi:hypothetical protein